jgi:hypothetical protein
MPSESTYRLRKLESAEAGKSWLMTGIWFGQKPYTTGV